MGADQVSRIYSLNYFNEKVLFGRSGSGALDHLKIRDKTHTKYNMILHMVLGDMRANHNWIEFYGLNVTETMDLEFSNYQLMVKEITKYNAKAETSTNNLTASILSGKSTI